MNPLAYAVLVSKSLPEELLRFLTAYLWLLHEEKDQYLFSSMFEVQYPFVELQILKNDDSGHQWKIRLPISRGQTLD